MWQTLRTVRPYLWRYRYGIALGMGALVLKDLASASLPLMIRGAIDALTLGRGPSVFLRFSAFLVGLSLVKGLFQYWMRVILIGISRDIEYDLRNDLFRHLEGLSPDFYARVRTGDIMARATNDLNAVRMMLGPGIMYWTETSLTFLLAIAIMVSVDWRLAFFALLPAPLVSVAVIFFGRRIHERFERIQAMFSDISSRVQENIAGVRMVRAFVQEDAELRRFEELNRDYIAQNIRLVRISGLFMPLLEALIGFTFLVVLWVGGYQVLRGRITARQLCHVQHLHGHAGVAHDRARLGGQPDAARQRLAGPHQPDPAREADHRRAVLAGAARTACAARSNFATWRCAIRPGCALDDVNLRIPAGSTVAVVGHTGSGKSTLVSLIPRLMDPTAGAVLVDGIDVRRARSRRTCAATSASCRRRRSCSARPSPRTSPSAWRTPRKTRFGARRKWPASPPISPASRTATRPWWASAASRSRAGRSSAPPSPAPCCAIRAS